MRKTLIEIEMQSYLTILTNKKDTEHTVQPKKNTKLTLLKAQSIRSNTSHRTQQDHRQHTGMSSDLGAEKRGIQITKKKKAVI